MTAVTSPSDVAHPFTVADLEGMPDDGRRYELIDGELLVSPAPGWAHQEAAYTLYTLLRRHCPPDLRVIGAPFAVRPDKFNEVQPDVLVARYTDLGRNRPHPGRRHPPVAPYRQSRPGPLIGCRCAPPL